jgi:hypothetical protein
MTVNRFAAATAIAITVLAATPASPKLFGSPGAKVRPETVLAEETFLAGGALRGRGSATPDEGIAAAYVASQFASFGLKPAPGMNGYIQIVPAIRRRLSGPATLKVGNMPITGLSVLSTSGGSVAGTVAIVADPGAPIPSAEVLLYTGPVAKMRTLSRAASAKGVKLIVMSETAEIRAMVAATGGAPALRATLVDAPPSKSPSVVSIPADLAAKLTAGTKVSFDAPFTTEPATITNAIGYLPGTDPKAGVLLLTAHLDHLGVRPDGVVMPGANDDASGTVAVMELARAFAAGKPMRRGILFVAYGAEEIGGLGSTYFGKHPPIPLTDIVANIEFEMIGAQDPKLPKGSLMMTGFERSNLGAMLKKNGALVASDPYPDQHFFERSDNYSLALQGIVAHTLSGWAVVPTYHQPTDTIENLDIPFMTRAIQSLIRPIRRIAGGTFRPDWAPDGRPKP